MAKTYSELLADAGRRADAGFTTKAAKASALECAASAYSIVRESFRGIGHKEAESAGNAWYDMPAAWREKMDSMPFSLAHWNAKRAAVLASYPAIVESANECAAMRAKIAAVPVVKKPPERTAKQRAADEKARTCQICGRAIFAETGVIAHHGYTRPWDGVQTASCYGARELPFEADSAVLVRAIADAKRHLDSLITSRLGFVMHKGPVTRTFTRDHDKRDYHVTFWAGTIAEALWFATPAFSQFGTLSRHHGWLALYSEYQSPTALYAECLRLEIVRRDYIIKEQRAWIDFQEKRLAAWVRREQWNATTQKWESV